MSAPAAATGWEARPAPLHRAARGAGRWGVVHLPTGRWVAFGSETRCRQMAAHLTAAEIILRGPAPADRRSGSPAA